MFADHDEVPAQSKVPGPGPQNEPAGERMQDGVRMADWHGGIHEVHSERCDGELTVSFSRQVARFWTALPSWFVRTGYAFLRVGEYVAVFREWVLWELHC